MKRDLEFATGTAPIAVRWGTAPAFAVALAVVGILLIYSQTAASIVAIWIRSETFAHGFVVVPLCLWLAWRRRDALARIAMRPWWWGLAFVFTAGALWLVASAASAGVVAQFALAFMLQAAVVTMVGLQAARVLAFALAFLLFAVPAGEFLVPTLVDWTGDFTIGALRLSGVPVYREGNHFIIPSGAWSVVEACSGIRYIIASVMVGVIYAAIAYRTSRRRALFIVASILVPIVANWLRAYMIVMLGHLSNNKLAVGVDHIIYGWVFFGVVMLLLFWVGSFWQEADVAHAKDDAALRANIVSVPAAAPRTFFYAALAAIAVAGVWQPLDASVSQGVVKGAPVLSIVPSAGNWTVSHERISDWTPRYTGYATDLSQTYAKGDHRVGLYIAFYRDQQKGRELITSGNVLTRPIDWNWKQTDTGTWQVDWNGRATTVERTELIGRDVRLQVIRLFWIAGHVTWNPYVAKALQAIAKLQGSGDDAALIVMYAPASVNGNVARESLRSFAADMSPAIAHALAAARESGK
jgi:exosortase A